MTKNSEFINQFANLNASIVDAISNKNFSRVVDLDKARQKMLQDLCLLAADDIDDELFQFIDACARENTNLIERTELAINCMTKEKTKYKKVLKAYFN